LVRNVESRSGLREIGIFDHVDRGEGDAAAFYAGRLALTELYDRYGFYSYHVAEHHSTPLGLAPSPNVYLSMVAARTRRLRVGALVYLLPLYHPLRLLEEICMLDQMSGGRVDVGVGKGISPIESAFYGQAPELSQRKFEETLKLLVAGFSATEITFEGEFYQFKGVPIEVSPFQTPRPPLWYGVSSPESAARRAEDGFNILTLTPAQEAAAILKPHRAATRAAGAPQLLAGIVRFIVVAATDTEALRIAEGAYPRWYESFNKLYRKFGRGPVHGERPTTFQGIIDNGTGIAGSPATVAAVLERHARESDSNYLVGQFAFGDMSHSDAARSIELFGRHVLPRLTGKDLAGLTL
jgi:alkanesulfonate monooxygenase SsuD/methylene tetrahydromethanopterin reductase-like flavin-dependent oxidoreductase (luciferase family)